jgi:hypothetical protein
VNGNPRSGKRINITTGAYVSEYIDGNPRPGKKDKHANRNYVSGKRINM